LLGSDNIPTWLNLKGKSGFCKLDMEKKVHSQKASSANIVKKKLSYGGEEVELGTVVLIN